MDRRTTFILTAMILGLAISPALAVDNGSSLPDFSGQWGRDMLFFEPAASGPGPIVNSVRKADGTIVARDPCCGPSGDGGMWLGDYTNSILKAEAAEAVKKFGDLHVVGTVSADLHNSCWPEPPPFVMALHFGTLIVQLADCTAERRGYINLPAS